MGAWASARGELLFALWNASGTPLAAAAAVTVSCAVNITVQAPPPPSGAGAPYAGVDVVTGAAFSVAGGLASSSSQQLVFVFQGLPIGDTPLLLAPPAALRLVPPPPAPAPTPAPASAPAPAPAALAPPPPFQLGIGTNLGNTMEAPLEGQWAPAAREVFFDDFKAAGFTTVRIPVRWDNHTQGVAPFAVNATWMARVVTVVGWCTARGLQCIINSHWDSWLDTNSSAAFAAALPRFAAIWRQVAEAFVGAPDTLCFESFNEPHLMPTPSLNAMLAAFYAAVRPLHPTRRLILGWLNYMGPSWVEEDHAANWNAMALPSLPGGAPDPHLAIEVHSYDPYDVCGHPVRPWGSLPSDVTNMDLMFSTLANWSLTHSGTPVFVGESGCTRRQGQSSRLAWYQAFFARVQATPAFGGGLVWDDDGEFGIYNRSTRAFDEGVLRAIGL